MLTFPLRLHHIGFVVAELEAGKAEFEQLGFSEVTPVFHDPIQKVAVQFVRVASEVTVELIQPIDDNSPVMNFLRKTKGGLHHLCYVTQNLDETLGDMRSKGAFITVEPVPAVAFQQKRIAFVMWNGHIIEFLEDNSI